MIYKIEMRLRDHKIATGVVICTAAATTLSLSEGSLAFRALEDEYGNAQMPIVTGEFDPAVVASLREEISAWADADTAPGPSEARRPIDAATKLALNAALADIQAGSDEGVRCSELEQYSPEIIIPDPESPEYDVKIKVCLQAEGAYVTDLGEVIFGMAMPPATAESKMFDFEAMVRNASREECGALPQQLQGYGDFLFEEKDLDPHVEILGNLHRIPTECDTYIPPPQEPYKDPTE